MTAALINVDKQKETEKYFISSICIHILTLSQFQSWQTHSKANICVDIYRFWLQFFHLKEHAFLNSHCNNYITSHVVTFISLSILFSEHNPSRLPKSAHFSTATNMQATLKSKSRRCSTYLTSAVTPWSYTPNHIQPDLQLGDEVAAWNMSTKRKKFCSQYLGAFTKNYTRT